MWAQGGQGSGPRSPGWGSVTSGVRRWEGALQGPCGTGCAVTGDCGAVSPLEECARVCRRVGLCPLSQGSYHGPPQPRPPRPQVTVG